MSRQPLACVTVNMCPSIVKAPLRSGPSDAATLNEIAPGPLPAGDDVIAIQEAFVCADQVQPASVATATLPFPPPAGTFWPAGAIDVLQP